MHIIKNIYQVAEFFINRYSKEEAEKITKILPDANKYLNSNYAMLMECEENVDELVI